ncbi:MAG: SDR family NAD(P)-dependent oxidoreductase [Myxococcota bacterium]
MGFLDGRTAIVTGAARGLGEAFATALAKEGARVVACDRDAAVEVVGVGLDGGLGVVADVSKPEDVRRLVDAALSLGDGISVLVNNAGEFAPTHPADPFDKAVADFDRMVGTNLRGAFLCGRAVAAAMIDAGSGGDIVNVSTDHVLPPPGRTTGGGSRMDVYDASKWGLRGLTEAWAKALRRHHVRVNELCMGATDTRMLRSVYPGEPPPEDVAGWMKPARVAALLVDLLREGPGGRTGCQIGVWVGHEPKLPPRDDAVRT